MDCSNFTEAQCLEIQQMLTFQGVFSFSEEVSDAAFYGCLKMFAIGLGVGLIISIVRKLKQGR